MPSNYPKDEELNAPHPMNDYLEEDLSDLFEELLEALLEPIEEEYVH